MKHLHNRVLQIVTAVLFLCLLLVPMSAQSKAERFPVENSNGQFHLENSDRTGDARFAEFLGRSSLWLKNNTQVLLTGLSEFTDGTIEFDVSPMDKGHFFAVIFRREAFQNHENIYFRAHKSGTYNAMQYAPRINGSSTWQLYPEFNTNIDLPRNQWTHVRIEVQRARLEVYLNNSPTPSLTVARLRHNSQKGGVGFWARVNDQPAVWAAAVSNISIRPIASTNNEPIAMLETSAKTQADTLLNWDIAGPVQLSSSKIPVVPQVKDWRKVEAEESGLVNLNRAFGFLRGRWTALARTTLNSDRERSAFLELAYSDDITVFLNGVSVYSGINGFDSRHPEYMGFVKLGFENVGLKLRPGSNELILAVSDDQRFGWGFNARLREQ